MAQSIRAKVKPEVLAWARTSAGYTEEVAAKKLGVKTARVMAWETPDGDLKPTLNQLRKMARVYKRPLAVFYLQDVPRGFQVMRDFRRLPDIGRRLYSPELTLEIRIFEQRRELALDLFDDLGEAPPTFGLKATLNEPPREVGKRIRDALGVTLDAQGRWRDPRVAFNAWRERIEGLGVLVFQMASVEPLEASGVALHRDRLPAIAVNKRDSFSRRVFSLFHELAHLMIGQQGVSEHNIDAPRPAEDARIEIFCNRVAAATLIPDEWFMSIGLIANPTGPEEWTDETIKELALQFSVSREAIVRCLLAHRLTTKRFYESKRVQFLDEFFEHRERQRQKIKESDKAFSSNPPRDALSVMGVPFVRVVLANHYQNRLTLSDVSRYLGLRVKHIPRIEQFVGFA